jgi:nicotinate-nucleotide--dimethylbenzimidazole phosphoribosyltransferase
MNEINRAIERIRPPDKKSIEEARKRQESLTKPPGSLGILEELSIKIAGIQGIEKPVLERKTIVTMAADHGVTELVVSAYPKEVTGQMVFNFLSGGAAINVIARHIGASVVIVDMGVACEIPDDPRLISRKVGLGTKNMVLGPAMSRPEAEKCVENGIEIISQEIEAGLDIVGTGDMGIGNTTSSAAVVSALTGISPFPEMV